MILARKQTLAINHGQELILSQSLGLEFIITFKTRQQSLKLLATLHL